MRTANLRRQHDAALSVATDIQAQLGSPGSPIDRDEAYRLSLSLAKLTGVLRIHFAQEDKLLYPALMASHSSGVAGVARAFFEEMGEIGPAYAHFMECWSQADAIVAEPDQFRTECTGLFTALADRIRRENEQLYPLADAESADWTSFRAA